MSTIAGLRRSATDARLSKMAAKNPKLSGTATTVKTTSNVVDMERRQIWMTRCPTFKKAAVVIAKATKTKAWSDAFSWNVVELGQ